MTQPELDGGRAIVIEDVPPGTRIADLIRAFSAYGPIRFASVGPPAVVAFETETAAAHALLVATMKSVSILGDFREKRKSQVPVPAPAHPAAASGNNPSPSIALAPPPGASPETEIGSSEASPAEAEVAAFETKMSPTTAKGLGDLREKRKAQVPAPALAQPAAASGNPPTPSIALAPPPGASPETEISPDEASPETEISPSEASPAEADVAASDGDKAMSPTAKELVDKILDRNMLMQDRLSRRESISQGLRRERVGGQIQNESTPAPTPAQAATCVNLPSSGGASMPSASENTEIVSNNTGGSNPAPHEERRLAVPWSVSVVYSLAALTEDECFYRFVKAYLCGVLFFAFFIMPIFNVPEVFP